MSKRMLKTVEAKTWKVRMVEVEGRGKEEGRRKEMRREKGKEEETKENGSTKDSGRMGDLGQRGNSKVGSRSKEVGPRKIS